MKITKRQLRRIIQESLNEALPPHLQKHFRADGSSVREPEWKDATPAGYGPEPDHMDSAEYDRGYQDGMDRSPVADDGTPDYDAGYEDGILDAEPAKWRPGDR